MQYANSFSPHQYFLMGLKKKKDDIWYLDKTPRHIYKVGMLLCHLKIGKGSKARVLSAVDSLVISKDPDFR